MTLAVAMFPLSHEILFYCKTIIRHRRFIFHKKNEVSTTTPGQEIAKIIILAVCTALLLYINKR